MIEVITSFNKSYYERIGKDCVDSWLIKWPQELKLTCYVEEFQLPINPRLTQIPFSELSTEYFIFQRSNENDRVKLFAKKAYSVIHAFENSKADRIIWLDADVITDKEISIDFLMRLCPDDTLVTFMGVQHHAIKGDPTSELKFSVESGVFVVNTAHKFFPKFAKRYREYYDNHLSSNLRRFYDGEVLGAVIEEFKKQAKVVDLASQLAKPHKTPLKHCLLGQYLSHYKSKNLKDRYVEGKLV
jgi:hypothetical protein